MNRLSLLSLSTFLLVSISVSACAAEDESADNRYYSQGVVTAEIAPLFPTYNYEMNAHYSPGFLRIDAYSFEDPLRPVFGCEFQLEGSGSRQTGIGTCGNSDTTDFGVAYRMKVDTVIAIVADQSLEVTVGGSLTLEGDRQGSAPFTLRMAASE